MFRYLFSLLVFNYGNFFVKADIIPSGIGTNHCPGVQCPPLPPCPAPPPNCQTTPPERDDCGCTIGCETIDCSRSLSLEGEICGGYILYGAHSCIDGLECVYTIGPFPFIADAPGTCQLICNTVRDQRGNCVEEGCRSWSDGCNTCIVNDNIIQECTEEVCYGPTPTASQCISKDKPITPSESNIPHNCATWFDGCNTCSVQDGHIQMCTLMACFRRSKPYCQSFHAGLLMKGDICFRYCIDYSQSTINRADQCSKDTVCMLQKNLNAFDYCDDRAMKCTSISGN